jgi:hypothetical protein
MDFGRSFTFAFEDKNWLTKIGIAGLLLLIPILGQIIVAGWAVEIARRVIHREAELLPDWSNFGDLLVKGLKVFVIGLVYSLPVILLQVCLQGGLTAAFSNADTDTQNMLGIFTACLGCVAAILGFALGLLASVAMGKFAATDDLGSAFRLGEIVSLLRAAPGAYLLAFLGVIIAGFLSLFGLILCIIGVVFAYAWAFTVQGYLYGQAYNVASGASTVGGAQAF